MVYETDYITMKNDHTFGRLEISLESNSFSVFNLPQIREGNNITLI